MIEKNISIDTVIKPSVMLEVSGLNKKFGEITAVSEGRLTCYKGEVHVLIGENGAGKSTLVKILCGAAKPDSGTIKIEGREVTITSPYDAVNKGIAAVFQELSLVPDMTVAENIFLAHEIVGKRGLIDYRAMVKETQALFDAYGFNIDPQAIVSELPLDTKQLVEIAKVLSKDTEIIIFDEATSALGKKSVELLFSVMTQLIKKNKTIIFISHRMDELEKIAHRATVFRDSKFIESFKWGTVTNKQIVQWIAGREIDSTFPHKAVVNRQQLALELKNLNARGKIKDICLKAYEGEIIGVAGLNGHGQIPFLSALFGAVKLDSGEIILGDKTIAPKNPIDALEEGIVLVPAERKTEGVITTMSIKHNMAMMTLDRISNSLGFLNAVYEGDQTKKMIEKLQIKVADTALPCDSLSGGNQQKVAIGKALLTDAKIVLFADPTRGVDIGTKAEIYKLINGLAKEGKTIFYYSTELVELVGLSNRVLVFKQGEVVGELEEDEIQEHNIINHALGIRN